MRNDADVIPFYRIETEDIYAWGKNNTAGWGWEKRAARKVSSR